MRRPRVMLADDHTLVVDAFRPLLDPEFEIVDTVAYGRALLERAPGLRPDVIVLDLSMPVLDGMDAGVELKGILPHTKIVVLTVADDSEIAALVLRQWASGYLLQKSRVQDRFQCQSGCRLHSERISSFFFVSYSTSDTSLGISDSSLSISDSRLLEVKVLHEECTVPETIPETYRSHLNS